MERYAEELTRCSDDHVGRNHYAASGTLIEKVAAAEPLTIDSMNVYGVTPNDLVDTSSKDVPLDSVLSSFILDIQSLHALRHSGRVVDTILIYTTGELHNPALLSGFCTYACSLRSVVRGVLKVQVAVAREEPDAFDLYGVHARCKPSNAGVDVQVVRSMDVSSDELLVVLPGASTGSTTLFICHSPDDSTAERLRDELPGVVSSTPCRSGLWYAPLQTSPEPPLRYRIPAAFVPVQYCGYRLVTWSLLEKYETELPILDAASLIFFNRRIRRSSCEGGRCFDCTLGLAVLAKVLASASGEAGREKITRALYTKGYTVTLGPEFTSMVKATKATF